MLVPVLADIFGIEALGQVEIALEGAALPFAADGVGQLEVEFRAIEGAVAGIDLIGQAKMLGGRVQMLIAPKSLDAKG